MGAALPRAVDCTVLERHGSTQFRVGVAEMNGWRGSMEDAHVIHLQNDGGYFGILDGHGGAQCSAWCSQRLHETLHSKGLPFYHIHIQILANGDNSFKKSRKLEF